MNFKLLIATNLVCLFFSCVKDPKQPEQDEIHPQMLRGMVFNQCTDSGLAGVRVFLEVFYKEKLLQKFETVSGDSGKFFFKDAPIHSSDKYTYAIHIPSKSGTNAKNSKDASFLGITIYFSRDETKTFFKAQVIPGFLYLNFHSNASFPIHSPDSINIFMHQAIFHKNRPDLPYSGTLTSSSSLAGTIGDYPMGMWTFEIKKWKNGIYIHSWDSLYMGWGDTKTYTVNW